MNNKEKYRNIKGILEKTNSNEKRINNLETLGLFSDSSATLNLKLKTTPLIVTEIPTIATYVVESSTNAEIIKLEEDSSTIIKKGIGFTFLNADYRIKNLDIDYYQKVIIDVHKFINNEWELLGQPLEFNIPPNKTIIASIGQILSKEIDAESKYRLIFSKEDNSAEGEVNILETNNTTRFIAIQENNDKTEEILLTDKENESPSKNSENQKDLNIEFRNKVQKLNSDGDITQTINMDGVSLIKNSGNAVDNQDLITKGQVDAATAPIATNTTSINVINNKTQKLNEDGNVSSDINMSYKNIAQLKEPTLPHHATTRNYVDSTIDDKVKGLKFNTILIETLTLSKGSSVNFSQSLRYDEYVVLHFYGQQRSAIFNYLPHDFKGRDVIEVRTGEDFQIISFQSNSNNKNLASKWDQVNKFSWIDGNSTWYTTVEISIKRWVLTA